MTRRKRVLLILSHSIEEHDQLKLLTSLGYDVFSLGGYINPHAPHDPKRPALFDVPHFIELQEVVDALGTDDNIGNAASHIPDAILDWLGDDGVIICHHYLDRIFNQWSHLFDWMASGGRVIWRTVGQSTEQNELVAAPFRASGLEIVRYSPKERNIPGYAGEDTMIRFYKDPAEWDGWTGDRPSVTNITQHLRQRDPWTNVHYYQRATASLAASPAGPGSEELPGGVGELEFSVMKRHLQDCRAYLYCGTQPASYTLGLLEALIIGIPVISIGPSWMQIFPYGHLLFEGHELSPYWNEDPAVARLHLLNLLSDPGIADAVSRDQRARAIAEFGIETIGAQWKAYLG